jgi:hypothetical protein
MKQESGNAPKVFLSHAGEDKERFVLRFAERLREQGVDVWLDRWEMLPGDSLIEKIFDEGIRNAVAIIVVISKYSAQKKWIREELNASLVKRINDGSLLIPVVLDDVEVPEPLKATLWEPISDPSNYEPEFRRVLSAIFGRRDKPPLGVPPRYAVEDLPSIVGLSDTDVLVLREFGNAAFESGELTIGTEEAWPRVEEFGVSREDFLDATEILASYYFLQKGKEVAPIPTYFEVTQSGFEEYLTRFHAAYPSIFRSVAAEIVNSETYENSDLVERIEQPQVIVDHVLHQMAQRDFVRIAEAAGGLVWVTKVMPGLKRYVRG